jgi:hypothetical protein
MAVANVNAGELKLSKIIDELPASIRENVRYTLDRHALLDRIEAAKTEDERVWALNAMAMFVKEPDQKDQYFAKILGEYPDHTGASMAYAHYLLKAGDPRSVSIEQYHAYAAKLSSMEKVHVWQAGYGKVAADKKDFELQYRYLRPLLDANPEFKDYLKMYEDIEKLSNRLGHAEDAEKAATLKNVCLTLPTLAQTIKKMEQDERKTREAAEKKQAAEKKP